jgi:hypothetical protein
MNLDEKKFNPTPLEFIQKTGKSISGQILTINNLLSYKGELDTWSKEIFKKIFNKEREYALFDD